jgi:hypothetical protein
MKIFINNFNIDILNDISELFKEFLTNCETFIILYTNEGIYRIEDKKIYFLEAIDKDIKVINNYHKNYSIIVDPSFYKEYSVSSIYGDSHLSLEIKQHSYKINSASEIKLIISYISNKDKLIPNDIYFESSKDIDINDIFIKKEIIEFLSMLN